MAATGVITSSGNRGCSAGSPRIEWVPIGTLRPNPRNGRTHSKKQIGRIAASIRKFGFLNPVIVDDEILFWLATGVLGLRCWKVLPMCRLSGLTISLRRRSEPI
jgi:hypothetical protein